MEVPAWITEHGFTLLQSIGIVTGLVFSGASFRLAVQSHQLSQFHTITAHHRELWLQLFEKPELSRILEFEPDLQSAPITIQEERFVTLLVLHLQSVFQTMDRGGIQAPEHLASDMRHFFRLPIPREVWKRIKPFQDKNFVQFVESRCLSERF